MERGIISLGSNMVYLQHKMNVVANNISNSSTYGYKQDKTLGRSFNSILSDEMAKFHPVPERIWNSGMVNFVPGTYVQETLTDFKQGRLEETGNMEDLALNGDGFFSIQGPNGTIYVRCLTLTVDNEGFLSSGERGRILGQNQGIYIGNNEFSIDSQGNVIIEGNTVDRLRIVDFNNRNALAKMDNGIFINMTGNENIINNPEFKVMANHLEASNVDLTEEMTVLIDVMRKYETTQRTIQMLDQIHGLAVNEIGKV